MATASLRADERTRRLLRDLATDRGVSMREMLARVVEYYWQQKFLDEADAAYTRLRADPDAWAEEAEERRFWDAVVADRPGDE